jgi:hypothetical protein
MYDLHPNVPPGTQPCGLVRPWNVVFWRDGRLRHAAAAALICYSSLISRHSSHVTRHTCCRFDDRVTPDKSSREDRCVHALPFQHACHVVNPFLPPQFVRCPFVGCIGHPNGCLDTWTATHKQETCACSPTSAIVADCAPFGLPLLLIIFYQVGIRMHYGE